MAHFRYSAHYRIPTLSVLLNYISFSLYLEALSK